LGRVLRCGLRHQAAHREVNPRLSGCREAFPVFGQTPVAYGPRERAFDDPALRQNRKPSDVGPEFLPLRAGVRWLMR
jgi:hypothetical protein